MRKTIVVVISVLGASLSPSFDPASGAASAQEARQASDAQGRFDGKWRGPLQLGGYTRCGTWFSAKVELEISGRSIEGRIISGEVPNFAHHGDVLSQFSGDLESDGSFKVWTPFDLYSGVTLRRYGGQMELTGKVAATIGGKFFVYMDSGAWNCHGTFALVDTDPGSKAAADRASKEFAKYMADDTLSKAIAEAEARAEGESPRPGAGNPRPVTVPVPVTVPRPVTVPVPATPPPPADNAPPAIEVPETVATKDPVVEFMGRVSDASRIVEVTVDARPVSFGAGGTLHVRRGVPQGHSTIIIAALDEWGNRSSKTVAIDRPITPVAAPATVAAAKPAQTDFYSDIHFGAYHALVVGNNRYRALNKLVTAEKDARAVAEVLRDDYGFDVHLLLNATRSDLIGSLAQLRAKLGVDDNLLIYYAGHGELDTVAELGYWLPVDADADVPTNWVSTGDITAMVKAIRAKHIMVVADSCYSGTLVRDAHANIRTARARRAWLERMARKRARTALVSGGLEPVLDGGGGGHSVFAKAFLDALKNNRDVMDGQALFDAIKRPVVVNADQTPQYSDIRRAGHDGGEFMFVRRR